MSEFDRDEALKQAMDSLFDEPVEKAPPESITLSKRGGHHYDHHQEHRHPMNAQAMATPQGKSLRESMPVSLQKQKGLMPSGGGELTFFQSMALKREQGILTKDQILRSLQLAFETEFKHVALQAALWLSHQNQQAVVEFLKATQELRRELQKYSTQELMKAREMYWEHIEEVVKSRTQWRSKINRLLQHGDIDEMEARQKHKKADAVAAELEEHCDQLTRDIQNNLMNMIRTALNVRVEHLIDGANYGVDIKQLN